MEANLRLDASEGTQAYRDTGHSAGREQQGNGCPRSQEGEQYEAGQGHPHSCGKQADEPDKEHIESTGNFENAHSVAECRRAGVEPESKPGHRQNGKSRRAPPALKAGPPDRDSKRPRVGRWIVTPHFVASSPRFNVIIAMVRCCPTATGHIDRLDAGGSRKSHNGVTGCALCVHGVLKQIGLHSLRSTTIITTIYCRIHSQKNVIVS